ncbi:MAG: sigma factor-like helix-turn-helix DNA-binding protein [Myxococcota bacterium]
MSSVGSNLLANRAVADFVARGHDAWPAISIPDDAFVDFVAERLDGEPGDPSSWATRHPGDLYLACGCTRLDDEAASAFVKQLTADVDGVFRRDRARERVEDFRQGVFEYLLVPPSRGERPRISGYRGFGRLRYWVRIIASRRLRAPAPRPELALLPGPADPPETAYLREYYREPFEAAVREAFETLSERERALLRFQLVDGMPVMAIAAMLRVHRVSVSRWLSAARADLLQRTRALMCSRFQVPPTELSSVVRLVRGALDVSPGTVLGPSAASGG